MTIVWMAACLSFFPRPIGSDCFVDLGGVGRSLPACLLFASGIGGPGRRKECDGIFDGLGMRCLGWLAGLVWPGVEGRRIYEAVVDRKLAPVKVRAKSETGGR